MQVSVVSGFVEARAEALQFFWELNLLGDVLTGLVLGTKLVLGLHEVNARDNRYCLLRVDAQDYWLRLLVSRHFSHLTREVGEFKPIVSKRDFLESNDKAAFFLLKLILIAIKRALVIRGNKADFFWRVRTRNGVTNHVEELVIGRGLADGSDVDFTLICQLQKWGRL